MAIKLVSIVNDGFCFVVAFHHGVGQFIDRFLYPAFFIIYQYHYIIVAGCIADLVYAFRHAVPGGGFLHIEGGAGMNFFQQREMSETRDLQTDERNVLLSGCEFYGFNKLGYRIIEILLAFLSLHSIIEDGINAILSYYSGGAGSFFHS